MTVRNTHDSQTKTLTENIAAEKWRRNFKAQRTFIRIQEVIDNKSISSN